MKIKKLQISINTQKAKCKTINKNNNKQKMYNKSTNKIK